MLLRILLQIQRQKWTLNQQRLQATHYTLIKIQGQTPGAVVMLLGVRFPHRSVWLKS